MSSPNRDRLYLINMRKRRQQLFSKLVRIAAGNVVRISETEKLEMFEQGILDEQGRMPTRMQELVLGVSDDE
jgi:hypothetical protein